MTVQRLTEGTVNQRPPKSGSLEIWDSIVPGFGVRISPLGKRSYFLRTRIRGKQQRFKIGTSLSQTLAEARGGDTGETIDLVAREAAAVSATK